MRKTTLISIFTVCLMILCIISCKGNPSKLPDEQALSMIKKFYMSYINERSKMPENFEKIDSIIKLNCSTVLQKQLQDSDIDYDLLLNSNTCEEEWLNTISISMDKLNTNIYYVNYEYFIDNKKEIVTIKLQIRKYENGYKIDKVL